MLDLDLDALTRPGRRSLPIHVGEARPLGERDLAALAENRGTRAPALQRLTDRHHALARALASGMRPMEAAILTGYQPSRVSILLDDPAFKELLEFYRSNMDAVYADLHARMASLSIDALEELRTRLEEAPESVSNTMLLDILKATADRTGHGPQSRSTSEVNVNVNIASRLEAARQRARERLINITPSETREDG